MGYGKTVPPDKILKPEVRLMKVIVIFENDIDAVPFGVRIAGLFLGFVGIHQNALFPVLVKVEFIEDENQIMIRGIDHALNLPREVLSQNMVIFNEADIVIIPVQIIFVNMIEDAVFVITLLLPARAEDFKIMLKKYVIRKLVAAYIKRIPVVDLYECIIP
jgi:hypothetical protein